MSNTERIGEIVESNTNEFVTQCYDLYTSPPIGTLIRVGETETVYGLVSYSSTAGLDPTRKPIPRGRGLGKEDEIGRIISTEEGKILAEGKLEVTRAAETFDVSADEARRLTGEVLPLDAAPGGAGKFGFTLRVPVGIVAAITPFNFPLNLVAHKVGPAIAAGNAVLIKPATDTPLSALKLVKILLEAGLPPEAIASRLVVTV